MPFGLGIPEIVICLVIAVLVFGPSRLPKLGKSMGEAIREFRNLKTVINEEVNDAKRTAEQIDRDLRR